MGWSEWPAWIKGGIILSGIYLFLFSLIQLYKFTLYSYVSEHSIMNAFAFFVMLFLIYIPIAIILSFISEVFIFDEILIDKSEFPAPTFLGWIVGLIIMLFITFFIGSLMGWIIGKIKS